jgi:hypothetical protein
MSTPMNDEAFLEAFERCTLPFDQWHHSAHIKVAYLYLRRYPLEEAMERVRAGIKAYNAANNVPELPDRGYHETMTHAWVRLVHVILCEYGPEDCSAAFFEQHPELSQKKILRLFYTRERFMSARATAEFVEPDLAPLPHSSKTFPGSTG